MLLDIYAGADGRTVRVELGGTVERDQFVQRLMLLANRGAHEFTVGNDASTVKMTLGVVASYRQERLTITDGTRIMWQRTTEGWLEAAELIEPLEVGEFQLLSQNSQDDAVVKICLSET